MMHKHGKCYGSTVMGERGQIVIPAEARDELNIKSGEKLIVFGNPRKGMVILIKSEIMTKFADILMRKAKFFEDIFGKGTDSDPDKD
jgi:AbrB family looped-hinge helix DNA binding protein